MRLPCRDHDRYWAAWAAHNPDVDHDRAAETARATYPRCTDGCECGAGKSAIEHHPWCAALWLDDRTHERRDEDTEQASEGEAKK